MSNTSLLFCLPVITVFTKQHSELSHWMCKWPPNSHTRSLFMFDRWKGCEYFLQYNWTAGCFSSTTRFPSSQVNGLSALASTLRPSSNLQCTSNSSDDLWYEWSDRPLLFNSGLYCIKIFKPLRFFTNSYFNEVSIYSVPRYIWHFVACLYIVYRAHDVFWNQEPK